MAARDESAARLSSIASDSQADFTFFFLVFSFSFIMNFLQEGLIVLKDGCRLSFILFLLLFCVCFCVNETRENIVIR